ncbi:family 16 glycosylhydrolase [Flavobacterium sp. 7A]|uniref:family 16 glycosylhydrolase n=1 Tax=Flavobacterium sp. 7A TaxID=2940571 RepID=UPI00222604BE|nr:family 16 glycosylhydrolase [Flavobacterium sp. 7A]MCW2120945.1 beta-glucanase (GH16 family) [Flavobacterium sp. 7A]
MNKINYAILVLLASYSSLKAQDSTRPASYYTDTISFSAAPKRMTDKLPLSHQKDKKWVLQKDLSDEFAGLKLDSDKWYDTNPKWLGRAPSMANSENVSLEKGNLVLRINQVKEPKYKNDYTHNVGWVVSKKSITYGYFEMRSKLMDAPWVSCFWLYNWWYKDNWKTEIDICENNPGAVKNRHTLTSNLHVFSAPVDKGNVTELKSHPQNYYIPFELQKDYHVWGMEWDKDFIRWYIDGILFRESPNVYWHQDLHINFNSESNKWLLAFPDDNRLNEDFNVDYVRVWQKK